jgi:hypothetical protein
MVDSTLGRKVKSLRGERLREETDDGKENPERIVR